MALRARGGPERTFLVTGAHVADSVQPDVQLRQPRLAEVVAGILRTRIVEGVLPDGSRLPKQDELLREFRVSRQSLREALRILEAEGLLTVQRGNVGGSIVRAPTAQSSAYMFSLVLQSRHVELVDLAGTIRDVEPVAAALCARRSDRATAVLPRLRTAQKSAEAAIDDGVLFTYAAREFHEEFVRSCGSETLIVMLGTLESMWSQQERQWAQRAQEQGSYPRPEQREEVMAVHESILVAIKSGDEDHAAKLVRSHLRQSQRYALDEVKGALVMAAPTHGITLPAPGPRS
jgi:DNA-binding FadR family transcriptional regulator